MKKRILYIVVSLYNVYSTLKLVKVKAYQRLRLGTCPFHKVILSDLQRLEPAFNPQAPLFTRSRIVPQGTPGIVILNYFSNLPVI